MRQLLFALTAVSLLGCEGVVGEMGPEKPTTPGTPSTPSNPSNPSMPSNPSSPSTPSNPTLPEQPIIPGQPVPDVTSITLFECTPANGTAPVEVGCRSKAAHSNAKALRCELTVSDGRAPIALEDCTTERTTTVPFTKAGTFTLTLTVKDPGDVSATKSATVSVVAPPNMPPVITSFTATPSSGGVPLATTLAFAVSDPEGDPLTCAIDVGGEGVVDYPMVDCAGGKQAHTVPAAGTVPVKLIVKDSKGAEVTSSAVTLTARASIGDVRIAKVEWGQSVVLQNLRLVGEKAALLRIHVLGDRAGIANVVVDAEGFDAAGTSLGKVQLTGPATPPVAEAPADLTLQWRGTVPATWVVNGFEVRIKVDPANALPESDEMNNALTVKPAVGRASVLQVTGVPVVNSGRTGVAPNIEPIMQRMWPMKGVVAMARAPYTFTGTITGGDGNTWGRLLQEIAQVRRSDGSNRNYYGYVRVNYGSGIAGIGYIGQEAATGRDDSLDTVAHELGHNMGRNHAPCGGAAGADPNYPYAGARTGSWGFDSQTGRLVNPAQVFDLMSYCQPEWVSDYNYRAVQTFLEAAPNVTGSAAAPYETTVVVAGVIDFAGRLSLRPLLELYGAPTTVKGDTSWFARLVFADGTERRVPLATVQVGDLDQTHFHEAIPVSSPVVAVQVLEGNTVRAERRAVAEVVAPTVTRLDANRVRVRWNAELAPHAQVAHFDAQGQRTTLALWLEGGDVEVRTDGLVGGHFEVTASDGVRSARAVVDVP